MEADPQMWVRWADGVGVRLEGWIKARRRYSGIESRIYKILTIVEASTGVLLHHFASLHTLFAEVVTIVICIHM